MEDVENEVEGILSRHGVTRSAGKEVTRHYAFELPNVPATGQYWKVAYTATRASIIEGRGWKDDWV